MDKKIPANLQNTVLYPTKMNDFLVYVIRKALPEKWSLLMNYQFYKLSFYLNPADDPVWKQLK